MDINNNCVGSVTAVRTDYLEVSEDAVNWVIWAQATPVAITLHPGTNSFTGSFIEQYVAPEYIYYQVRAHVVENQNCAVYDFTSVLDWICTPTQPSK